MVGGNTIDETARAHRARVHAEVKRDNSVTNIKKVFEMSAQVGSTPSLTPKFLRLSSTVDDLWTKFSVEQESLLMAVIDLDTVQDFDSELEPSVRDMIASIQVVVDECSQASVTTKSLPSCSSMGDPPNTAKLPPMTPDTRNARLPKIPLPSFNGTIHAWPVFRDRFTVLVHNFTLSDIEKYYYLLSCLQPCAAEVIKGINVSGDTYPLAWLTLVQRFDKPRQLAGSLVDKLFNAPVYDKETLPYLSAFLNVFEETSAGLSALNIPDLSAYLLFTIASRCLPLSCRKLFEAENCTEYPSISQLLTFVKSRVQILENSKITRGSMDRALSAVKPATSRGHLNRSG